ncbi:hypothetical protein PVAND_011411 [Polypedilum vanderplanki]|uniref:Fibroblast growth factor n=1 Tax=Polypedilum vanderplanki TaxID=319348 RepID=A0A9J6CJZ4_POLVA|nr:hypothetical protein PVAND_011411 [Polypedilum vanderplanki]
MKKWFRLMDLALLGLITTHLIVWQMLLVCAASPLKSFHTTATIELENNQLQLDNDNDNNSKSNNNQKSLPRGVMELSNNVSYEISTNTQNEISHVFNNYLSVVSINDKDIQSNNFKTNENNNNASQISSIYEIFFINNESNLNKLNKLIRIDRSAQSNPKIHSKSKRVKGGSGKSKSTLDRNERSANLSHITGSTRKIQLYIKNRFLQLLPDGTVNGTTDDLSDYTILQRTTVNVGQIKIQGVATCLFLCMDSCGFSYGSIEFTDDCIFNESMEQHHYNTYSSTRHSNAKRTFYLGLNRHGVPRKIQLPSSRQLGKLSTYTKSLTQTVAHERVDQLITRLYGANHIRHGLKQLCDTGKVIQNLKLKEFKNHKCNGKAHNNNNNQNKKKKRKKKCRGEEGEVLGQNCINKMATVAGSNSGNISINDHKNVQNKKKSPSIAINSNNNQKKCSNNSSSNEECIRAKPINNSNDKKKKQLAKKNGQGGKQQQHRGKKKAAKSILTTTPKPEEEYIEHDVIDLSLEEDEDYDEINTDVDREMTHFNSENQYE